MINKVIKNSFIYMIVLILPQVTSFFLLPLYTRYLTPADYAITALVGAFTSIVVIFITLQIQSGLSRYVVQYSAKGEDDKAKEAFTSIMLSMVIFSFFFYSIVDMFGDPLVKLIYPKSSFSYSPYFKIAMISMLITSIYQAPQALFKSLQLAKKYLYLSIFVLIITAASNIYFLVFRNLGVYGIFLGSLVGSVVGLIASLWLVRSWFVKKISWGYIKPAIMFSIPLIPHSLGTYLFTMSNRIVMEKYLSMQDIGIFSIADKIATVPLLLVNAFNIAYNPQFIAMAVQNKDEAVVRNEQVMEYWWAGVLFMLMCFIVYADCILRILTTKVYFVASGIAIVLAISCVFRGLYSFSVNSLFYAKKTYLIPIITLAAGIASIVLNIVLIPIFGIIGAAWVTVLSYALTFFIAEYISRTTLKLTYPIVKMVKTGLVFIVVLVIVNIVKSFYSSTTFVGIMISSMAVMCFVFYLLMFHSPQALLQLTRKLRTFVSKEEEMNSAIIYSDGNNIKEAVPDEIDKSRDTI